MPCSLPPLSFILLLLTDYYERDLPLAACALSARPEEWAQEASGKLRASLALFELEARREADFYGEVGIKRALAENLVYDTTRLENASRLLEEAETEVTDKLYTLVPA